ncbi:hypothetical protein DFJ63DRAFT_314032 [Scheffersomyces coipomensis]|uniref:uncharacterized protein n=1 Tax=Scheffersomyces coipomensis TaxID=1788519 RepID=UPI00315DAA6E
MQFSKFFLLAAASTLVSKALSLPTSEQLLKRDDSDNDDVVILTVQTTVQNIQTNIQTVEAATSTFTNVIIDTQTTTFTRYTATVTSTIFGTPYTFTTIASTPIGDQNKEVAQNTGAIVETETEAYTSVEVETLSAGSPSTEQGGEYTEVETLVSTGVYTSVDPTFTTVTITPSPGSLSTDASTTTALVPVTTSESSDFGPNVTETSIPSSSDSWILENITTVTSNSVCIVNYDYYNASESEADETTTLTSTIYTTVTNTIY